MAGWWGFCPLGVGLVRVSQQAWPQASEVCSSVWWGADVTSGTSFPFLSGVLYGGPSWSRPWGTVGVGGGQRLLGFFSWWVVGLEQSQAAQSSLPQPPPPPVHGWDRSSSSDLIWSQSEMIAFFFARQLDLIGAKFKLHPATHWLRDPGRSLNFPEPQSPHL